MLIGILIYTVFPRNSRSLEYISSIDPHMTYML